MRRIAVIALLVLPVVALVVGWRIWTRPPALVVSLRALPEVAKVEYTGSANAPLVVVHFLDWHFVPTDLCKLEGINPLKPTEFLRLFFLQSRNSPLTIKPSILPNRQW
jgi:hypothetical protein